jgi:hypothetical protein
MEKTEKELLQILLDHVNMINKKYPRGLCDLTTTLVKSYIISKNEETTIKCSILQKRPKINFWHKVLGYNKYKNSNYFFKPGCVFPRKIYLKQEIKKIPEKKIKSASSTKKCYHKNTKEEGVIVSTLNKTNKFPSQYGVFWKTKYKKNTLYHSYWNDTTLIETRFFLYYLNKINKFFKK